MRTIWDNESPQSRREEALSRCDARGPRRWETRRPTIFVAHLKGIVLGFNAKGRNNMLSEVSWNLSCILHELEILNSRGDRTKHSQTKPVQRGHNIDRWTKTPAVLRRQRSALPAVRTVN